MTKRKYTQRKRAEQQDETRRRIVEATMALHEELGASQTSISAVAEEAGVQRLTVYRHFPDESELLEACTTRWLELHPMPEPVEWEGIEEPVRRIRAALKAFHAYYAHTRAMWETSYRDRDLVPALGERMDLVEQHVDAVTDGLIRPMGLRGRRRELVWTTVRHGLRFSSWQSLVEAGIEQAERSSELVMRWLDGVLAASRNRA